MGGGRLLADLSEARALPSAVSHRWGATALRAGVGYLPSRAESVAKSRLQWLACWRTAAVSSRWSNSAQC